MSTIPGSTLADSERLIADLQRQLAERTAERDEASRRLDERTAERDEAQAQQTATAEVLGVINSSPGDLTPVFDAILEKAHAVCGAATGSLQIYDGESIRAVATRGLPDRFANPLREPHRLSLRNSRIRAAFLEGVPYFQISDLSDTVLTEGYPTLAAAHEITGTRTLLNVPLRKDGELLGVIVVGRLEVRPFTDKEIALLQNFAAQAVIAMENARLLTETREALEQQTATAEVLQVINSSPGDLAPVFDAMLDKALRLCGAAQGALWLIDAERGRLAAAQGLAADFVELLRERGEIGLTPPLQRVMRGERVIHYLDTKETELPFVEAAVAADVRTLLWVALVREGTPLGAFAIARREVRAFSDKEIALLQNFAAQAVIAIENARLLIETREALEQQTATAEVLQVINSSPGDLAPVFDAILEKAHTLCGAEHGALVTFDGEMFRAAATRGLPEAFAELLRGGFRPLPGSAPEPLVRGERCVHIVDMAALAAESTPAAARLLQLSVDLAGTRTLLLVPLRKDGALLGYIAGYRQEVRPFTDKQIALLQNFAAQAVIAMENARLLTETREALEQQTATAEVLQVINSSPDDLAPVFDAMLEKAMLLGKAAFGGLFIREGDRLRAVATRGLPDRLNDYVRQGFSGSHRLARGAEVEHIADLMDDPLADRPARAAAMELGGARTMLSAPLRKDDTVFGYFSIFRQEVRPFTDKQIALLQNFAAQAVIAMENARLLTETREALEQQTATAEVLQVINSSPGDLTPVFDAMLEKASRLCDAAVGSLWTYDGEYFHAVAVRNVPPELAEFVRQPHAAGPNTPLGRVVRTKKATSIQDLATNEMYRSGDQWTAAPVELGGARSYLAVPLLKDDALVGAFALFRREVQPFSDQQIALLENFAAQAVIAMENARLITETREALEQQTATAEVLQVINSSPGDLAPVFDAMLEKATRLCEASFGILRTWDGERFHFGAANGDPQLSDWVRRRGSFHPDGGSSPLRRIIEGEQVVQVADASSDAGYSTSPAFREMVEASGMRSVITVALRKDEALLGTIHVYRQEVRPFTDKQIALLQNFSAQAVIAMENARLLDELHQRTDQIAELNRGLEARVAEQVDELGRVGRLKRFLAPQLAELIVSHGDEKILESHRRDIVVAFCDLRGYTAFTETAEPEEVLDFLREYHGALGPLVSQFEGTLDQFSGDGIMVFFNDPVPCPDPAERAVKMAMAMREEAVKLITTWRRDGCELGFGAGIAQGYATLGQIGFSERSGYTAIGTVCNLAARLCAEAKDGQILISSRVARAVEAVARLEDLGNLELKGLRRPVAAFNIVQSTSSAEARPNFTVVVRGPGA